MNDEIKQYGMEKFEFSWKLFAFSNPLFSINVYEAAFEHLRTKFSTNFWIIQPSKATSASHIVGLIAKNEAIFKPNKFVYEFIFNTFRKANPILNTRLFLLINKREN